jgi:hypothetical protein
MERDHAEVRFMDQGSGLQSMFRPLAAKTPTGHTLQLVIDAGHELIKRLLVSRSPAFEKLCDVMIFRHTRPAIIAGFPRRI